MANGKGLEETRYDRCFGQCPLSQAMETTYFSELVDWPLPFFILICVTWDKRDRAACLFSGEQVLSQGIYMVGFFVVLPLQNMYVHLYRCV
jgi:hypothetical protein